MWAKEPTRATFHYGTVNPAILRGFAEDDDSGSDKRDEQSGGKASLNIGLITTSQDPPPNPHPHDPSLLVVEGKNSERFPPPPDPDIGIHNDVTPGPFKDPAEANEFNPYLDAIERRESLMTQSYLRQVELTERHRDRDRFHESCFGRRYQIDADAHDVLITNQRMPAAFRDCQSDRHECIVCTEKKDAAIFSRFSVTSACSHRPNVCLDCIETSIRSDLASRLWSDIRCPECREFLDYADIQQYADEATFRRYENHALKAAVSQSDNFIWCTSGCGFGQVHAFGREQPIVTCSHCRHRSCFTHDVAWHDNLTCEEYDQFLADPEIFHLRSEAENEEIGTKKALPNAGDQGVRIMNSKKQNSEQREMEKRATQEREDRRRAQQAIALAKRLAATKKQEEEKSRVLLGQTTKPCPGCRWAIEKNKGCSHMTCIKCRFEFCWECLCTWSRGHTCRSCTTAH